MVALHPDSSARARLASAPAEAGELLLMALDSPQGGGFLARRAERAVEALPAGPERRRMGHVLRGLEEGSDPAHRVEALLAWAGHLESRDHLPWAARVLRQARSYRPDDPELLLHQARLARKAGRREEAGALYDRVAELDAGCGRLSRMAEVGQALLADDPAGPLARALRGAVRAGDTEAAAVAQEARARHRRARGDVDGALRDYLGAALRYGQPADAGRIGHEAADLLGAARDPLAARVALLAVERHGHPEQAERARARLLALSRSLGDELGLRRWADAGSPGLVSLTPRTRPGTPSPRAGRLARRLRSLGA